MLTVYNQELHISLAKGYDQKSVQPLKIMIYVAVLGREAISLFLHGSTKQGKINVKIGHFKVNK